MLCTGVWVRTLTLLLSLDTVHTDDFDFILAVTPRDDDTTVAYARAAGFDILEQGEALGLSDLWNKVIDSLIRESQVHASNPTISPPLFF